MQTPFFGAHEVSRSTNFSDAQLYNLYPEISESKQGKGIGALFGMPGLTTVATCGAGPINGIHVLGALLYVVSGNTLYSVTSGYVATSIGAVGGTGRASIVDNGTQMAIFRNGSGTSYSVAAGLAAITMPFTATGTIVATYEDGFGLINQPATNLIFQSDLLDLTSWNALNFASASGNPDNLVGLRQLRRQIYAVKEYDTEVWINAGTSGFTFQRLDGAFLEVGCAAPWSLTKIGESLMWLAQNKQGSGVVVEVIGYNAKRISTSAIENEIQGFSTISDAIGYSCQYNGHSFYVLTFPTANVTFAYDKTTSDLMQTPMWLKWMCFPSSAFGRNFGNNFALFNGVALVGDYQNGKIYQFDPAALTDAGTTRKWLRTWRALAKPSMEPVRFSALAIDMETGGTGTTGTPTVSLRWSDDGGHTWSSPITVSVGALGATMQRVFFTRLGSTRRNSGLDRIFELSSTGVFPPRLIGAELT